MSNPNHGLVVVNATDQELSNLIQRLTYRIEALEAALREIAKGVNVFENTPCPMCRKANTIARAALDKDAL